MSERAMGSGASCAHLWVEFCPIDNDDGTKTERWICTAMCGQEFVRSTNPTPIPDREPQPTDGPDYHADHAAWERRQTKPENTDA